VNVILAGGVLLLGLASASLFRRSPSSGLSDATEGGQGIAVSGDAAIDPGCTSVPSGAGIRALPPTAIPSYYARPADRPRPPLPRPPHVPPVLDGLYQSKEGRPVPKSLVPILGAAFPPVGTTGEAGRTHVIVDGDTLAGLAARYLGDPRRSVDIFEANRRVLADPDVLPIGAELQIPLPITSPSPRAGFSSPESLPR
jgi:nucleoid-associated protein YgaU